MRRLSCFCLLACGMWRAAAADNVCPKASPQIQAGCKEVTWKDLPARAKALLRRMNCEVRAGNAYDYGSAVDLNGDGSREYQFCCHESPHGPCSAVLIGKVGGEWKDLTAKEGLLGFDGACTLFVVLESEHHGYHDACLPDECASPSTQAGCAPKILRFDGTHYR